MAYQRLTQLSSFGGTNPFEFPHPAALEPAPNYALEYDQEGKPFNKPQGGGFLKGVQKIFGGLADTFGNMSNEQMAVLFGQIAQAITSNVPNAPSHVAGKFGEQLGREAAYQKASKQLAGGAAMSKVDTRALDPEAVKSLQGEAATMRQEGLKKEEIAIDRKRAEDIAAYQQAQAKGIVSGPEQVRLSELSLRAGAYPRMETYPSGAGKKTSLFEFNPEKGTWDLTRTEAGMEGVADNRLLLDMQKYLNDQDWKAINTADEWARNLVGQTMVDEKGNMVFTFSDPAQGEAQYRAKFKEMLTKLVYDKLASPAILNLADVIPAPVSTSAPVAPTSGQAAGVPRFPSALKTQAVDPLAKSLGSVGEQLSKAYTTVTKAFKGKPIEEGTYATIDEVKAAIANKAISEAAGIAYTELYFDGEGNYIGKPRSKKVVGVTGQY